MLTAISSGRVEVKAVAIYSELTIGNISEDIWRLCDSKNRVIVIGVLV